MSLLSDTAGRASGYLRKGPGGINVEKILTYVALAAVIYLGYKAYKVGKKTADIVTSVVKAPAAVGSALGRGLYTLFHPGEGAKLTSTTYTVYFPEENAFHAVDSRSLDDDGGFARSGKFYDLVTLTPRINVTDANGNARTYGMVAKRVK